MECELPHKNISSDDFVDRLQLIKVLLMILETFVSRFGGSELSKYLTMSRSDTMPFGFLLASVTTTAPILYFPKRAARL